VPGYVDRIPDNGLIVALEIANEIAANMMGR